MSRIYEVTFKLRGGGERIVMIAAGTRGVAERMAYKKLEEEDKLRCRRPGSVRFWGQG